MENPIITEFNELFGKELLQSSLPACYKKDHSFYSLSSAAKRLKCIVEDVKAQVKKDKFGFAQAIWTDTGKYHDGRECLYESPVFRITKAQLRSILDKDGDTIDLDPELNGWLWLDPPRQVRVEVSDLRVQLPSCDISDSDKSSIPDEMESQPSPKELEFNLNEYVEVRLKNNLHRNQIAFELFNEHGNHSPDKISLCKIGLALGLPEPTWAIDRKNKLQMKRESKGVGAIKTQVRRWINNYSKKVTPSHPTVTP